jgi:4-hydroxy-tetrahydrodipicolinate synthase
VTTFKFGLAHAPVTPFANGKVDTARYGKILDFHLKHGAEALALPMHAGESVSLTADERKALLEFAVAHVQGRAPIIVNVSEAGTALACALASHAAKAGAAALIANVPYYWTPPQSMLVEHFAVIAKAGGIPLFVLNSPDEMNQMEIASKTVVELLNRAPNFLGLIDSSLDWQYMIEIVTLGREARPDFQFVSGTEYMISAAAVGATGMVSSVAAIAPTVVKELYSLCLAEKFNEARPAQEKAAILFRALREHGVSTLKAAMKSMGRECGTPRAPLPELDEAGTQVLLAELAAAGTTGSEPRDWV